MLKIGVPPYINALPLCRYLPFPVTFGTPAELEQGMANGSLDMALLPTFSFFKNPSYIPFYEAGGIQSEGSVESILLFYRSNLEQPHEIMSIKITEESRTSVNLLKVLFESFWEVPFSQIAIRKDSKTDGIFEIGDRALFFNQEGFKKWDLGQAWTQWTGKPFVYAFWVSRQELSMEVKNCFIKAKEHGLANKEEIIKGLRDLPENQLRHYLTKNIQYELNEKSFQGMELFKKYCLELGLL